MGKTEVLAGHSSYPIIQWMLNRIPGNACRHQASVTPASLAIQEKHKVSGATAAKTDNRRLRYNWLLQSCPLCAIVMKSIDNLKDNYYWISLSRH